MRIVLRSTLILAIVGTASSVHALESGDWDALEDTAQHSLEYGSTDEPVPWVNPDSGTEGTFTPIGTHEGPEGQVCREYAVDAIIEGREEVVYGTACRLPDGSWVEANAEYLESDPPAPATEVYSGTDWSWIIRNISISGGYCSSSFCVGGRFGSYYPSWYYPWSISFGYWNYARWDGYYPYYGYGYGYSHGRHYRYPHHSRTVSHHRNKHRSHYRGGHETTHRGGHHSRYLSGNKNKHRTGDSKRAHSPIRSQRDRPTNTRPRSRQSEGERYVSIRSESRRSSGKQYASHRSGSRRSGSKAHVNHQSGSRHSGGKQYARNRSGSHQSVGQHSSGARSGRGRAGGQYSGRSSRHH